jgi:hypothetical protein
MLLTILPFALYTSPLTVQALQSRSCLSYVTLRLTVSQSVCLGIEPRPGLMTRCLLLFDNFCYVLGIGQLNYLQDNSSARATWKTLFMYCCVRVRFPGNVFTEPLLSNGRLFIRLLHSYGCCLIFCFEVHAQQRVYTPKY